MKKILILSDSLAAPRAVKESWTAYEATWPSITRVNFNTSVVAQCSIGSATTSDLVYQTRYWEAYEPDIVFIQAGLVDCVPRAMRKFEKQLVGKILPYRLLKFLILDNAVKLRKWRNISYTNQQQFASNVRLLKNTFPNSYWIQILSGNEKSHERLPDYVERINCYNSIIENIYGSNYLIANLAEHNDFVEDGFHLSSSGHAKIAKIVAAKIES